MLASICGLRRSILAPLVVGAFGFLIERTIIRFLYGRMIDTMLATWGLSLALVGAVTMIFGNTTSGVSTPLGSMPFGRYELSNYNFALMGVAIVTIARAVERAAFHALWHHRARQPCRTRRWRARSGSIRVTSTP